MTWVAIAVGVGGAAINAYSANKTGKQQQQAAADMSADERQFAKEQYNQQLQDMRPDQKTDYGELTWTQDKDTGKWTQENKMNPAEAARLGDYRQIAADRMAAAKGISSQFAQGGINYEALGLGKLASAAGVQGGGNSTAASAGGNVIGQPSWGMGQKQGMGFPPNKPMPGFAPPGVTPNMAPGGAGGGMLQPPSPQGPGAAGGMQRQPYTPAPVVPDAPPPAAPPPAAPTAAPPPAAAPQGMGLDQYMNSGMKGLDNNAYQHFGGDSILEQMKQYDPNASWGYGDIGSGGDDPHPQQGRVLNFDPRLFSAGLRK